MARNAIKKLSRQDRPYLRKNLTLPSVPGAKAGPMPRLVFPMLATLHDQPFAKPDWLFEAKLGGVRAISYLKNGQLRIYSRSGKDIGFRYPELLEIADSINAEEAILDGEIVALNEQGKPSSELLQSRAGLSQRNEILRVSKLYPVVYFLFDILYYNGFNLMPAMLVHRKGFLRELLEEDERLTYCDHVVEDGVSFFEEIKKSELEGIIGKNMSSSYSQGRSREWLMIKAVKQGKVVGSD